MGRNDPIFGRALQVEDAPELWDLVHGISAALGAADPDHLVVGLAPNFYALLNKPVATVDGSVAGRTIFISLALARIFTQNEFRAAIAHELTHLHFHCAHAESWDMGQEFQADLGGSRVAGRHEMAAALVKSGAFSGYATGILGWYLENRRLVTNFSDVFAQVARLNAQPRVITWLQRLQSYSRASNGKGSTEARLENLQIAWEEVESAALSVTPEEPASALIRGYEQIEEELTGPPQVLAISHPFSFWSEPLILPEQCCVACGRLRSGSAPVRWCPSSGGQSSGAHPAAKSESLILPIEPFFV